MAEITRRRTGELLRALFNILMPMPDGMRASEALQTLSERVTLTPYEADTYESVTRPPRTQEKRRITLLDMDTLFDLWVEHYGKLSDPARRRLPLRPIQFLAPKD